MNDARAGLWPIGSFASAAQLTLKALRLYDQLGLLKPSYIDPDSGYRYYRADQLYHARLIRMLRTIDMPLATIRHVLAAAPADAETLVHDHLQQMERRLANARHTVQSVIAFLRHEENISMDVEVRTVAAQPIVSITRHVKVDRLEATITNEVQQLLEFVRQQGGQVAGTPLGLYHGPINAEEDGPIEICVPLAYPVSASGDAQAGELSAGKVAVVTLRGDDCDYPRILTGYDATYDWIKQQGYEHAGSPREVWISAAGVDSGVENHVEIAWPFREHSS
jgi:DNA-binding transcriptional MerR regulator